MLLSKLRVLTIDCQAAKGHLLEVGWSLGGAVESRLVKLPEGATLPERVLRTTGLTQDELATGEPEEKVWRLLDEAAKSTDLTAIHFARFEEPYLKWLHHRHAPDSRYPFRVLCTHHLVSRLVPELPRRSLRAAAGFFGHAMGERRRAGEHVAATLSVWHSCVELLDKEHGIRSLTELELFLNAPAPARSRSYPMPAPVLAELPAGPGVYRMLRDNRDVLYVGKATSLRQRVRSYFAPGARHAEHTLEMLSQARNLEVTGTPSVMEAALLEVEEIHRLDPPYNKALRTRDRSILFATRDLGSFQSEPDPAHRVGPLLAGSLWNEWPEAARGVAAPLSYGARLWRSDPELGELRLSSEESERRDEILRRASHLVRRAHWFQLIQGGTLRWREGTLELGERAWTVVEYDRYVVFTSELRRLLAAGMEPELRTRDVSLRTSTLERLLRSI